MNWREERMRRLIDEMEVMENGIEILESIEERNCCDSHTIEAISAFLRHLRRFKANKKRKETIADKKWWKEHEEKKASRKEATK